MKKPLISKRFFTNLLVVLFGAIVLLITLALTAQVWFPSADLTTGKTYTINGSNLYIYDQPTINSAFGFSTGGKATAADPFVQLLPQYAPGTDLENPGTTPSEYYALISLTANFTANAVAYDGSPTMKLLKYATDQAALKNDAAAKTVNIAYYRYQDAVIYKGLNYRFENDILYFSSSDVTNSYQKAGATSDGDVTIQNHFPNSTAPTVMSLAVNTKFDCKYIQPHDQSIALTILERALGQATSAENQETNLFKTAPAGTPKLAFHQDAGIIQRAISNYQSQVSTSKSGVALKIESLDSVKYGENLTLNYSADFSKLGIDKDGPVDSFQLKIAGSEVCNFSANQGSLGPDCSWDSDKHTGSFVYGAGVGSDKDKIGTNFPGPKTFYFAVFRKDKVVDSVSKVVNVGYQTGDSGTTGGSVQISISVPSVVSKKGDTAKAVPVKISAPNLSFSQGHVAYLAWYVCHGPANEALANSDDETKNICTDKKEPINVKDKASLTNEPVSWDVTGTPDGDNSIMVKAYYQGATGQPNPYVEGSKVAVGFKVTSDALNPDGTIAGSGSSGAKGGGSLGGMQVSTSSTWTGFKSSAITTIEALLASVGGFTMLILGALAVIAIIIAGMRYITSGGEPQKAEAGKKALLFAVYGIVLAVLCVTLVKITYNEAVKIFLPQTNNPANTSLTSTNTVITGNIADVSKGPTLSLTDLFGQKEGEGIVWEIVRLAMYWAQTVAVFFILYASFQYLTSYGEESKAEAGKKTLIWAIIGLAFILGASYLLTIFTGIII